MIDHKAFRTSDIIVQSSGYSTTVELAQSWCGQISGRGVLRRRLGSEEEEYEYLDSTSKGRYFLALLGYAQKYPEQYEY